MSARIIQILSYEYFMLQKPFNLVDSDQLHFQHIFIPAGIFKNSQFDRGNDLKN